VNGRIGEVIADGAIVDTLRGDGGTALQFEIHRAKLNGVTHNGSLTYNVEFHNPLPPGEIRSSGTFGKWNTDAPGQTPLAGRYRFEKADLSVFQVSAAQCHPTIFAVCWGTSNAWDC
jgi:hypothetical protein